MEFIDFTINGFRVWFTSSSIGDTFKSNRFLVPHVSSALSFLSSAELQSNCWNSSFFSELRVVDEESCTDWWSFLAKESVLGSEESSPSLVPKLLGEQLSRYVTVDRPWLWLALSDISTPKIFHGSVEVADSRILLEFIRDEPELWEKKMLLLILVICPARKITPLNNFTDRWENLNKGTLRNSKNYHYAKNSADVTPLMAPWISCSSQFPRQCKRKRRNQTGMDSSVHRIWFGASVSSVFRRGGGVHAAEWKWQLISTNKHF